jgi:hypothetical protein
MNRITALSVGLIAITLGGAGSRCRSNGLNGGRRVVRCLIAPLSHVRF